MEKANLLVGKLKQAVQESKQAVQEFKQAVGDWILALGDSMNPPGNSGFAKKDEELRIPAPCFASGGWSTPDVPGMHGISCTLSQGGNLS